METASTGFSSVFTAGAPVQWAYLSLRVALITLTSNLCSYLRDTLLKGHCVAFGGEIHSHGLDIKNIDEVITQTQLYLLLP